MNDARFCTSWSCRTIGAFLVGVLPVLSLAAAACGGGEAAAGDPKSPATARPEALIHEDCPEAGHRVDKLDTNADGKPDIRRVYDGAGHELCRIGDLNHDGKADLYEYFDANGTVRRREFCYDDTGVVNAIEHYEGGRLASREYDADGQHRIDTWDFFDTAAAIDPKTGRPVHPVRRERDTTGNGKVDQWWTWSGDKVTIAVDSNGDGKADPDSAILLGGSDNGAAPPPAATSATPGDAGAPAALVPTPAPPAAAGADGGRSDAGRS